MTVPGAVDGWAKMHERFGKLPWSSLFESAIAYAECGFPVSEVVRELWAAPDAVDKLQALPETAGVFLPGNKPPQTGDLFRNRDLAAAYRMVAEEGSGGGISRRSGRRDPEDVAAHGRNDDRRGPGFVLGRVGGADLD